MAEFGIGKEDQGTSEAYGVSHQGIVSFVLIPTRGGGVSRSEVSSMEERYVT